jgi:hypothetical protein
VDHAFGNPLAVEVGVLFEQLPVLNQERPARAGANRVLIIRYRCAVLGGQRFFLVHPKISFVNTAINSFQLGCVKIGVTKTERSGWCR